MSEEGVGKEGGRGSNLRNQQAFQLALPISLKDYASPQILRNV
jgi:hypothetical protein